MKRNIIEINENLCVGCGQCITACAKGAIQLKNGKAKLVSDQYCDGLGVCIGHCPTGALKIIEREAKEFDKKAAKKSSQSVCHCPNAQPKTFNQAEGTFRNWPIQISLVPEKASFLDKADLLIAADCTAFSDPNFSQKIKNKVLLVGCPKLDNAEFYIEKLAGIFTQNKINSITVLRMSVSCCQRLSKIVQQALQKTNNNIPCHENIINV